MLSNSLNHNYFGKNIKGVVNKKGLQILLVIFGNFMIFVSIVDAHPVLCNMKNSWVYFHPFGLLNAQYKQELIKKDSHVN
jgi:hypothetical protein